jgi:hypothetical protein
MNPLRVLRHHAIAIDRAVRSDTFPQFPTEARA